MKIETRIKKVRQQLRRMEGRRTEAGQERVGRMDKRREGEVTDRFMTGQRGDGFGLFSFVRLWRRNEFCFWILLTPPQHIDAI